MPKPLKLKVFVPTEDVEAQCLMRWAGFATIQGYKIAEYLIMVPNGVYLGGNPTQRMITMAKLKRTGFMNGVSDYFLAIPTNIEHGLWLELKRRELGIVSDDQRLFLNKMQLLGYATVVARGWEEAKTAIENYLM